MFANVFQATEGKPDEKLLQTRKKSCMNDFYLQHRNMMVCFSEPCFKKTT